MTKTIYSTWSTLIEERDRALLRVKRVEGLLNAEKHNYDLMRKAYDKALAERDLGKWAPEMERLELWNELPRELREEIGDRMSALRAERNEWFKKARALEDTLDLRPSHD